MNKQQDRYAAHKKQKQLNQEEQELAGKIMPLIEEQRILLERRGNGCTLEKNSYIGYRDKEINEEISRLKSPKNP